MKDKPTNECTDTGKNNMPKWLIKYAEMEPANVSPDHLKRLVGFPGFYAGDNGLVYYNYNGKYKPVTLNRSKGKTKTYYDVSLHNDKGERVVVRLNRLIARTWIDHTLNLSYKLDKRVVDHINNDTLNNSVSNLQVITQSENLKKRVLEDDAYLSKKRVTCWVYDGIKKRYYKFVSVNDASDWLIKVSHSNTKHNAGIYAVMVKKHNIRGKRWSAGYTKREAKANYDAYMTRHNAKILGESCM